MEFQAVLDAVRSLPVEDQVRLVDQIQDDLLGEEPDPDLTPELMEELDRRMAEMEANPDAGIPWEQVLVARRARGTNDELGNAHLRLAPARRRAGAKRIIGSS